MPPGSKPHTPAFELGRPGELSLLFPCRNEEMFAVVFPGAALAQGQFVQPSLL